MSLQFQDIRYATDFLDHLKYLTIQYKNVAKYRHHMSRSELVSEPEVISLCKVYHDLTLISESILNKTNSLIGTRSELRKVQKMIKRFKFWLTVLVQPDEEATFLIY